VEIIASAIWRRVDTPGHDACWLLRDERGWMLDGAAIFKHAAGPARLAYRIQCDTEWRTLSGMVLGYIGNHPVSFNIARLASDWTLNGTVVRGLNQLDDLDLSFTPATNLLQLRRQDVPFGKSVSIPVALARYRHRSTDQPPTNLRAMWDIDILVSGPDHRL
jgi:hypothetical protein